MNEVKIIKNKIPAKKDGKYSIDARIDNGWVFGNEYKDNDYLFNFSISDEEGLDRFKTYLDINNIEYKILALGDNTTPILISKVYFDIQDSILRKMDEVKIIKHKISAEIKYRFPKSLDFEISFKINNVYVDGRYIPRNQLVLLYLNDKDQRYILSYLHKNNIEYKLIIGGVVIPSIYFDIKNISGYPLDEIKIIKNKTESSFSNLSQDTVGIYEYIGPNTDEGIGEYFSSNSNKFTVLYDYNQYYYSIVPYGNMTKWILFPKKYFIFYSKEKYNEFEIPLEYQKYPVEVVGEEEDLINESLISKEEKSEIIRDFIKYCIKELDIKTKCKIILTNDKSKTETLAHYNSEKKEIVVYVKGRLLADSLRSLAHEIFHLKQNELNLLKPDSGKTGSNIENEANAGAGIIIRNYGKNNKDIFEN